MPYLYETHLHTSPVSRCARASVEESVAYYKSLGYAGVFITNHFINTTDVHELDLEEYRRSIEYYCSDYEEGARLGKRMGISVFFGIEMSYHTAHFLVYGLDPAWLLSHPEIVTMPQPDKLAFLRTRVHSSSTRIRIGIGASDPSFVCFRITCMASSWSTPRRARLSTRWGVSMPRVTTFCPLQGVTIIAHTAKERLAV